MTKNGRKSLNSMVNGTMSIYTYDDNWNYINEISIINYYKNDPKNLLALIFIIKSLLKRFKTEGNTYSLKRWNYMHMMCVDKQNNKCLRQLVTYRKIMCVLR